MVMMEQWWAIRHGFDGLCRGGIKKILLGRKRTCQNNILDRFIDIEMVWWTKMWF